MDIQYKTVAFEVKDIDSDGRISGYGAVFGNVDGGGDVILPKAFDGSIEKSRASNMRPKMLWQHDPGQPIGVWDTMSSDTRGLFMQGRILADVSKGRDALALLRAKAVDGLSIGYRTIDSEMKENDLGMIREIKEAEVWETSIVTFPMNEEARVTDVKQLQSPRDVEQLLRKAGVPGGFAKLVAMYGFKEATERLSTDSGNGDDEAQAAQYRALKLKLDGLKEAFNA
jgi:hypothetical protein